MFPESVSFKFSSISRNEKSLQSINTADAWAWASTTKQFKGSFLKNTNPII
jgi:hypothetical protein